MLKVDHLKIYEHYKLLRVVVTSNILIKSKLNDKEKIQLAEVHSKTINSTTE